MQNEEKKNSKGFIANMKSELKKVVWPTGKQTAKSTAVTIGFVLLISVILIILNLFFDFLSDSYYNLILGPIEGHDHDHENEIVLSGDDISGDDISGDLADALAGLSGENSGEVLSNEISGETEVE